MFCQQLKTCLVGNLLVRYANNLIAHLLEGQRPIIVCLSARDRIMNDRALAFEDNGRMLAGFFQTISPYTVCFPQMRLASLSSAMGRLF